VFTLIQGHVACVYTNPRTRGMCLQLILVLL